MGTLKIIDGTGHTQVDWDEAVQAEVVVARNEFERLLTEGHTAVGFREIGQPGEVIETFDPSLQRITWIPQVVGG